MDTLKPIRFKSYSVQLIAYSNTWTEWIGLRKFWKTNRFQGIVWGEGGMLMVGGGGVGVCVCDCGGCVLWGWVWVCVSKYVGVFMRFER